MQLSGPRRVRNFDNFRGLLARRRRASLAPLAGRERFLHFVIHQSEGRRERGVYTQIGRVQQGGINRLNERGNRAVFIGCIADIEFRQDILLIAGDPQSLKLKPAAMSSHLGPRIDEELRGRVRGDDGADVATVDDGARRVPRRALCERALIFEQRPAHRGQCGDLGGGASDIVTTNGGVCRTCGIDRVRGEDRIGLVRGIAVRFDDPERNEAIERAGVQMRKTVVTREQPREGSLAARGRAVDSDDDAMRHGATRSMRAPRPFTRDSKFGKLVAIIEPSSTRTGFEDARPMIRKLMAIRWSIWVSTSPPPPTPPAPLPSTIKPSGNSSTMTPFAFNPAATAAKRSDSLTRSSSSPRMIVLPSAKAAATASTGYSSIMVGARSGGTSTPLSAEWRTARSPTSSPPSSRRLRMRISAPISCSVTMRPIRRGLSITPFSIISEPGTMSAATNGNAADEGSLGTAIGTGFSSASPVIEIALAPSGRISSEISAPKALTMRSV